MSHFDRRHFLRWGTALFAGAWIFLRKSAGALGLRPPGARPEDEFLTKCIRCFRCAEVCPPRAIVFELSTDARTADTPLIHASTAACTLCMRCTEVCPTGALEAIPSDLVTIQKRVKMGTPVLDRERCLPWSRSGVCRLCYYACPYPDRAVTVKGPMLAPIFHEDQCVGCGLCEEACPTETPAIRIAPPAERR